MAEMSETNIALVVSQTLLKNQLVILNSIIELQHLELRGGPLGAVSMNGANAGLFFG